jgi:hypothetical protein
MAASTDGALFWKTLRSTTFFDTLTRTPWVSNNEEIFGRKGAVQISWATNLTPFVYDALKTRSGERYRGRPTMQYCSVLHVLGRHSSAMPRYLFLSAEVRYRGRPTMQYYSFFHINSHV